MPLADTLLRLAEHPRLYLPKWSKHIMDEVTHNLIRKWNIAPGDAERRERELLKHFPEAMVAGYEPLIELMNNAPKDRHVLAAAVRSNSDVIITYNAKDFPQSALEPWGIERQGPSTFLRSLYDLDPGLVVHRLHEQAETIGLKLEQLLVRLRNNVPGFVSFLCEEQTIEL
jgi:predicted nucleic acid-binding protein